MLFRHGIRGSRRHGIKLCAKGPRPDRLPGQPVPLTCVFLVPDFLSTHRDADEPHRTQKNRADIVSGNRAIARNPPFWRQLRVHARLVLSSRHRQRIDADLAQPPGEQPYRQRQTGLDTYIRTIRKSHRVIPCPVAMRLGCHNPVPHIRPGLALPVCNLCSRQCAVYCSARSHPD